MKEGSELFGRTPAETVRVAGPIDPDLQTLSLVAEQGSLRGLVVNFALHVDVIGGGSADFVSADWPGELAGNIAAVYGVDLVTVFLQGAAGDINHNTHDPTFLPKRGSEKAVQLGRPLAGAAMCAAERAEPMIEVPLSAEIQTLSIPYYTRDAAFMAELAELKKKPEPSPFERYVVEKGDPGRTMAGMRTCRCRRCASATWDWWRYRRRSSRESGWRSSNSPRRRSPSWWS